MDQKTITKEQEQKQKELEQEQKEQKELEQKLEKNDIKADQKTAKSILENIKTINKNAKNNISGMYYKIKITKNSKAVTISQKTLEFLYSLGCDQEHVKTYTSSKSGYYNNMISLLTLLNIPQKVDPVLEQEQEQEQKTAV